VSNLIKRKRKRLTLFRFTSGLTYDMTYCWIVRFNTEKKIVKVRAYLDTELLTRAIEQNK
jgi:ketosteroid isomerase-like protein